VEKSGLVLARRAITGSIPHRATLAHVTWRRAIVVVAAALAVATGVAWWTPRRTVDGPYAALRQAVEQPVPGTFGYVLGPPEGVATADPNTAYTRLLGAADDRDVALTLATVTNADEGYEWGPAWVFITHDLCYFTAKGDLVSPGRSGRDDACTRRNMLVQVVDAASGDMVAAFPAFDLDLGWLPQREGTPTQAGVTRFH
jgi:hypothetical protein